MKLMLGIVGILFIVLGTISGLVNWFFVEYYLESVNWEDESAILINKMSWLANIVFWGLGATLIGFASILNPPNRYQ